MRLPPSLNPWMPWLGWFEPELAGALGQLLLRLHPLLGAFRLRAQSGQAEPEGIDDLRRRGSYDRLLLSEWALAEAAPEEFDRRAAAGEHLFLSPKLVARQVDALTVAVFDTGPAQLGAPRLVHVAMWILLAQRAQAAKARFAWGVLSRPGELHEADAPALLKRLLTARTLTPGGAADGARADEDAPPLPPAQRFEREWAAYLDGTEPICNERWSIGAPGLDLGLGHRVAVRRGEGNEIEVLIAARQARREAVLALPDPAPSARLLRGEFQSARAAMRVQGGEGRASLKQPPLISSNGRSVAVLQMGDNAARIYRVPPRNEGPQSAPTVMRWGRNKHLLAARLQNKELGGIVIDDERLAFWGWDLPPQPRPPLQDANTAPGQARLLDAARLHHYRNDLHVNAVRVLLLSGGNLLSWSTPDVAACRRSRNSVEPQYEVALTHVLAVQTIGSEAMYALRVDRNSLVLSELGVDRTRSVAEAPIEGDVLSGFVACPERAHQARGYSFAAELRVGGHGGERSRLWRVFHWWSGQKPVSHEIILPVEWKVVGLDHTRDNGDARLLALRPDRCALIRIGAKGRDTVYESATRISTASVNACDGTIAMIDMDGRLIVLRPHGKDVLIYGGEHG